MYFALFVGVEQFKFMTFHAGVVEHELAVVVFAKSVVLPNLVRVCSWFYRRLENVVWYAVLQVDYASVGFESMTDCGGVVVFHFFNLLFIQVPFVFGIYIVAFYPKFNKVFLHCCEVGFAQLVVDEWTFVNGCYRSHRLYVVDERVA